LEAVLPAKPSVALTGEEEDVTLAPFDPHEFTSEDGHSMDDDEDGGRPQRVQCAGM
jgi:hypothetical protein